MMRWLITGCLILVTFVGGAAPAIIGAESVEPLSTANLTQWTIGLMFVLLLIIAAAWLTKRFTGFGSAQAGQLKVLSGVSLGSREKAVLIRAGKQHILLGVAPGRVVNLHTFEEGEIVEQASQGAPLGFQESLQKIMNKQASQ